MPLNKKFSEMIIEHLADIAAERCTITDQDIVDNPNETEAEILSGIQYLFESLQYKTEQLRSKAQTLDLVLNNIHDGIIVCDLDFNFILWNEAGKRVVGIGSLNVKKEEWSEKYGLFKPDRITPLPHEEFPLSMAVAGKSSDNVEVFVINEDRPQGGFLSVSGRPLLDENKKTVGGLAVVRDVTKDVENAHEIEKQRGIAVHSAKLASVGELAAGVGHEILNPLAILKGQIDKLKKSVDSDGMTADQSQQFEKSSIAIERISRIVDGLRTYSRTDTDYQDPIDIHRTVETTLSLIETIYEKSGIKIFTEFSASKFWVKANIGKFQQVLMNLMSNARDAMEGSQEKRIRIRTEDHGDKLRLVFSDSGSGMTQATLERLFDPFFTTKAPGKGTGIGMGMIHSLLSEIGATIHVETELGRGTAFKIDIPRTEQNYCEVHGLPRRTKNKKFKGRALVVDDEPDLREILREDLEELGLEVDEAENGEEGLQMILSNQYHFVFTDIQMPKMTGCEMIVECQRRNAVGPKYVVISGGILSDYSQEQRQQLKTCADGILRKPFDPEKITEIIASSTASESASGNPSKPKVA